MLVAEGGSLTMPAIPSFGDSSGMFSSVFYTHRVPVAVHNNGSHIKVAAQPRRTHTDGLRPYGAQTPCGPTILPRGAGKFSSASLQISAVTPSGQ